MTKKNSKIILSIATLALLILWVTPIFLVIINALKEYTEVVNSKSALPNNPISQGAANFQAILDNGNLDFVNSFIDSVIITCLSLFSLTICGAMAAWVLVRTKTKSSNIIFMIFVASMVIPFQAVMLPLVSWFAEVTQTTGIQLTRSYQGIVLAYTGFGSALTIFMYHGFIKSIPFELEEAARIDGCNQYQIFLKIILPILKPITITLLILNGIWVWNDFLLPLVLLGQGNAIQTLPLGISFFIGSFVKQWELIMMCLILSIIPVIVLFIIGQKHIIRGMVGGAVK